MRQLPTGTNLRAQGEANDTTATSCSQESLAVEGFLASTMLASGELSQADQDTQSKTPSKVVWANPAEELLRCPLDMGLNMGHMCQELTCPTLAPLHGSTL